MKVTPWEVSGEIDYERLIKEFGTTLISEKIKQRLNKRHLLNNNLKVMYLYFLSCY